MRGSIVCSAAFATLLAVAAAPKPAAKTLKPAAKTLKPAASQPGAIPADLSAGRAIFVQSCAPCHGLDAKGSEGPALKGLTLTAIFIAKTVHDGVKNEMPAFGAQMKPEQIRQVTAYVGSLQKR